MGLAELARAHLLNQQTQHELHTMPALPHAVYPPGTGQRSVDVHKNPRPDAVVDLLQQIALDMRRLSRQNFDVSNPVEEYQTSATPVVSPITLMRNYDIPERIESFLVLLPVGITSATLQLGDRFMQLYQGAATAVVTLVTASNLGIILSPDDVRQLTFVGAATSGASVFLFGHCLEREGNR
jgi:hypothetical protein